MRSLLIAALMVALYGYKEQEKESDDPVPYVISASDTVLHVAVLVLVVFETLDHGLDVMCEMWWTGPNEEGADRHPPTDLGQRSRKVTASS